jgi:heat shock factor-binding protein 1
MADKSQKNSEDPSTKELNAFVQNLLKQMQDRFEDMSGNIIGRIDEMGKVSHLI